MHNHRILAIFLDCGDTLVDEGTEVKSDGDVSLRADLIPGAADLLHELKRRGYPLALVADGPVATFENNLGPYGLYQLFDAYAISEVVGVSKPDAAMFERALQQLHIQPQDHARVLMVGNHLERDIKGANAQGLTSVWLDWAPRRAKRPADASEQPDFTIKTPLELLDLLAALERGAPLPKATAGPSTPARPTSPATLSLANVAYHLRRQVQQNAPRQIVDPAHSDHGGLYSGEWGMVDPKLSGHYVFTCGQLLLAGERLDGAYAAADFEAVLESAIAAAGYLRRAQHASGLIDLLSVNYDSAPDTAFTVQELCTIVELGRGRFTGLPRWSALLDALEAFIRAAVPGMMTGGFHTPNHRWVIVSALVQAKKLFPDLDVEATVQAYLAEGYDIDDEGAFIERSVGVYDAVNDRSLLLIAAHRGSPEAVDAAVRNLDFNLHLLHADGSAETGLSRRQDYGTRRVAVHLIPCYLLANRARANPLFVRAAQWLWEMMDPDSLNAETVNAAWITYALLATGEPGPSSAALPADFSRFYPHNGVWRVRRGLLSTSLFQHTTRLLTFAFGEAELSSLKISQTYFGQSIGRFVSNQMCMEDEQVVLHSAGRSNPRRPAYELPLNKRVAHDDWDAMLPERSLRRLPHAVSELIAHEAVDVRGSGLDLHYITLDGAPGVAVQAAFDFPPGGVWETGSIRTKPGAGQVIFLKEGYGSMRYGNDVIEIGPGALAHGMWAMRDAEPAPEHVRVLLTFTTPVDCRFSLRAYRGVGRSGH